VTTNVHAAAAGEDGRSAAETRALLLATTGGEPPDETVVWQYAPADSRGCGSREIDLESPGTEGCLTKGDGKAAFSGFGTRDGAVARAPGPSQREIGRWNPSRVVYCGAVGS